jgi:hypothetical protein
VTKVINDQNVELQISHKRKQINLAYRLKKLVDPAKSKFLDEKLKKRNSSDANFNELISD